MKITIETRPVVSGWQAMFSFDGIADQVSAPREFQAIGMALTEIRKLMNPGRGVKTSPQTNGEPNGETGRLDNRVGGN